MKKAFIYFDGSLITSVNFEKIESNDTSTFLSTGYGDEKKVVAKVPNSHLIIIE